MIFNKIKYRISMSSNNNQELNGNSNGNSNQDQEININNRVRDMDNQIIESFIQSLVNMNVENKDDLFFSFEVGPNGNFEEDEEDADADADADADSDDFEPLPPLNFNPQNAGSSNPQPNPQPNHQNAGSQPNAQGSNSQGEQKQYVDRLTNIFRAYAESYNGNFENTYGFNFPKVVELNNYVINIWGLTPNSSILNVIRRYYYFHNDYPETLEMASYEYILRCNCGLITEENIMNSIEIFMHFLKNHNTILDCARIIHANTYYLQENRYPDITELRNYISNISRMVINPEQYHSDNKVKVSTKNLDKLKPVEMKEEGDCCICTEPVKKGCMGYVLPCKHIFHSNEEECIEGTILKWLGESNKCPMCKTEVNL